MILHPTHGNWFKKCAGKKLFSPSRLCRSNAQARRKKQCTLSCSTWTQAGKIKDIDVSFCNAGPVLFGCADYVPPLMEYVDSYGINLDFGHNSGEGRRPQSDTATFKVAKEGEDPRLVERKFDMLHVCPPQCAPDFIKDSPLGKRSWLDGC